MPGFWIAIPVAMEEDDGGGEVIIIVDYILQVDIGFFPFVLGYMEGCFWVIHCIDRVQPAVLIR